jgi:hypothetical protein
MAILWCGGEDIDFPGGTSSPEVLTTAGRFRSTYARCTLRAGNGTNIPKSNVFPGGAVTSCWLSFQMFIDANLLDTSRLLVGLVKSGTTGSGLWIATSSSSRNILAISKYDGTTKTQLAVEAGSTLQPNILLKVDIQLVNFGATATVNVFVGGTLIATYTGDVTVSGVTDVDRVGFQGFFPGNAGANVSEFIVASEDTRAFPGLATLALTGDGTTTDWTGTFSTINGTTLSDATPNYTNTSDLLQEFDVTNLPSGTFKIRAIKIAMRAAKAAGTPTQIALGYNEGGTVTVEGDIALTTAYATYEQLDVLNPRTSGDWDQSILNALQITAKSRA